ncbi:MAG TPA: hypothetical protein VG797_00485 [Phycisphaerales bacterium]|nr:hypothetical protein [Phycisphaerales bacterium]
MRLSVSNGYVEIARLQGGLRGGGGGENAKGQQSIAKAIENARKLADAQPDNRDARRVLGGANLELASLTYRAGDPAKALEHLTSARDVVDALVKSDPKDLKARRLQCSIADRTGECREALKDRAIAAAAFEESLNLRRKLYEEARDDPALGRNIRRDYATGLNRSVGTLRDDKKLDEALALLQQVIAIRRELAASPSKEDDARSKRDLAQSLSVAADLNLNLDKADEARAFVDELAPITRALREADPTNPRTQADMARLAELQGRVLFEKGDARAAAAEFDDMLTTAQRLLTADPTAANQRLFIAGLAWLNDALVKNSERDAAITRTERAARTIDELIQKNPDNKTLAEVGDTVRKELTELHEAK